MIRRALRPCRKVCDPECAPGHEALCGKGGDQFKHFRHGRAGLGSRGKLEQVFVNLLSNAIDALSGRPDVRIDIVAGAHAIRGYCPLQ